MWLVIRARRLGWLVALAGLVALLAWAGGQGLAPASTYEVRPLLRYYPGYADGPPVSARAAILMDVETGTVLYAKNEHDRLGPASTTKIMTAILALERGDLDEPVTIGRRPGWVEGSRIYLKRGQVITLRQLLYGLLMESGNDAAIAIGEYLYGSEQKFTQQMTRRAQELGCWNTRFADPHGLSRTYEGHYTTAFDLALMARRGLSIPEFSKVVRSRTRTVREPGLPDVSFRNTNRLLWYLAGADGVKTGTTSEAGYCLVASANRDGFRLLAVVLDAGDRWRDASTLLEYGFREFQPCLVGLPGEPVGETRVRWGMARTVPVVPARPVLLVVRRSEESQITTELAARPLVAPVRSGDPAGRLLVRQGGELITSAEVTAALPVARRTLWRMLGAGFTALLRLAVERPPSGS
ncbi:MAG: D-alanyl-D-alanine carboxypeptidase family protein [Chitinophagales bacterium]